MQQIKNNDEKWHLEATVEGFIKNSARICSEFCSHVEFTLLEISNDPICISLPEVSVNSFRVEVLYIYL